MFRKIKLAERVLREEGPYSLARHIYWKFADTQTVTTRDTTVVFSVPKLHVADQNRYRIRSEQAELTDLVEVAQPGDVFYDIGANTGIYSLHVANACPDAHVIAFEPYAPNVKLLRENIALNDADNMTVHEIALSDSEGLVEFAEPSVERFGYGTASIVPDGNADTLEVRTTAGDQLIVDSEVQPPNIVKIDVEGAESVVIEGLKNALSSPECRLIYCEVHLPAEGRPSVSDFETTPEEIERELEEMGFSVTRIQRRGSELVLKGEK